jgi:hypothetical protein
MCEGAHLSASPPSLRDWGALNTKAPTLKNSMAGVLKQSDNILHLSLEVVFSLAKMLKMLCRSPQLLNFQSHLLPD